MAQIVRIIMARVSTVVILASDLSGETGAETVQFDVPFALKDVASRFPAFKMDLLPAESEEVVSAIDDVIAEAEEKLRAVLAEFYAIHASLKAAGSETKGGAASKVSTGDTDAKAVREWARANGHNVADRGRIHADILKAYSNAHRAESAPVESWDNSVAGDGDVTITDGPTDSELEALEAETV
jgi:hypothetical protein